MSSRVTTQAPATEPSTSRPLRMRRSWSIVGVIVGLELRQRARTTRRKITRAAAFLVISAVVVGSTFIALSPADATYRGGRKICTRSLGALLFLRIVLARTSP